MVQFEVNDLKKLKEHKRNKLITLSCGFSLSDLYKLSGLIALQRLIALKQVLEGIVTISL